MTPSPGIEPGTHLWKASSLTTAPTPAPRDAEALFTRPKFYENLGTERWPRKLAATGLKSHTHVQHSNWDEIKRFYIASMVQVGAREKNSGTIKMNWGLVEQREETDAFSIQEKW